MSFWLKRMEDCHLAVPFYSRRIGLKFLINNFVLAVKLSSSKESICDGIRNIP